MHIDQLKDGQRYVDGRSEETALHLIGLAEAAGLAHEVFTTNFGYIVPESIFPAADAEDADADKADADADSDADADADADDTGTDGGQLFDPVGATIAEVKDYLDGSDDTERERVLAAEAASEKPRKGVLELAEAPEGAK
jgi:hypothetical protein